MERATSLFVLLAAVSVDIVIASPQQSDSVVRPPAEDLAQVDGFIQAVMSCRRIPGLSLTVTSADQVLLENSYGWADLETQKEVTNVTVFPVASITKSFTSTVLALILQNNSNNYTFETPLQQMLGEEFRLYDDLLTEQTTLRDLLAHKTGITEYILIILAGFPVDETKADTVKRLRYYKPKLKFRTKFMYSNTMYALAGHVVEVLEGGQKWEDIIHNRIFQPLGMTSSTFAQRFEQWDTLATPYVLYADELCPVSKVLIRQTNALGPAGSILSTGSDMAKWVQFHLNGGVTSSGERLLSEAAMEDIYRAEMPEPSPMSDRNLYRPQYPVGDVHIAYNLGWITNIYRGYKRVWHSGGLATYKSQLWMFPDQQLGIYATLNGPPTSSSTWGLTLLLMYVSDVFLRETPWLNATTACSFPAPWGTETEPTEPETPLSPLPNDPLPESASYYESKYSHPGFGEFIVTYNTSSRQLLFHMGELMEGILQYDAEAKQFNLNLTGKYWYSTMQIPVRFHPLDGTQAPVHAHMPLNAPFKAVDSMTFYRDGYGPPARQSSCSVNGCPSAASPARAFHTLLSVNTFILMILTIICILASTTIMI